MRSSWQAACQRIARNGWQRAKRSCHTSGKRIQHHCRERWRGTAIPSAKGCKFDWIAWRIAGGVHSSLLLTLNCLARRSVIGRVTTKAMTTPHLSCAVQIPSWIGSVNDGQDGETRNGHDSLRDGRGSCRAVTMVLSKPLASERTQGQGRMGNFDCRQ